MDYYVLEWRTGRAASVWELVPSVGNMSVSASSVFPLIFSVALGSSPLVDLLGMLAGHVYYYFEDVYPTLSERRDLEGNLLRPGRRVLATPAFVKALFPAREAFPQVVLRDDAQRGGGERARAAPAAAGVGAGAHEHAD